MDQEEAKKLKYTATETTALMGELALMRLATDNLRNLMLENLSPEVTRGSSPIDPELYRLLICSIHKGCRTKSSSRRQMHKYLEQIEQFDNAILTDLVEYDRITELRRETERLIAIVEKILDDKDKETGPLRTFALAIWRNHYPPCLRSHRANQQLRMAHDVMVAMQFSGTVSKLLMWPFHGGWPWQWPMDISLWLIILGHWGSLAIAFVAGHRDTSPITLAQVSLFVLMIFRLIFPNWWEHRWEWSFVFPVGFLCYKAWTRPGIQDNIQQVLNRLR